MNKTVLITGATAGFGKAMADRFAKEGCRIIITGRRKDRLSEIAGMLEKSYGASVQTLCFDIRRYVEVKQAIGSLTPEWKSIDILINNAGLAAGLDFIQEGNIDDWDQMIDTNVKGLLYVTREVTPGMVSARSGHIINIGSTASRYVYEKGGVYNATKFAVDALTQGLRIDLLKHQVKVTAIHPGAAETEFSLVRFKGDEEKAHNVYKGFDALRAEDIADIAFYVSSLPAHVCINDLMVTPTAQANAYYINRSN